MARVSRGARQPLGLPKCSALLMSEPQIGGLPVLERDVLGHLGEGAGALVRAHRWYRGPFNTSNQSTSLSDAIEFSVCP